MAHRGGKRLRIMSHVQESLLCIRVDISYQNKCELINMFWYKWKERMIRKKKN